MNIKEMTRTEIEAELAKTEALLNGPPPEEGPLDKLIGGVLGQATDRLHRLQRELESRKRCTGDTGDRFIAIQADDRRVVVAFKSKGRPWDITIECKVRDAMGVECWVEDPHDSQELLDDLLNRLIFGGATLTTLKDYKDR